MHFLYYPAVSLLAAAALCFSTSWAQKDQNKPNVVFILTDDQDVRMESLSYMQQVQGLLMSEGTTFTKHYVHSALCCPSRLTLWSGQLAHNTNVTEVGLPGGGWPKVQDVGLSDKHLPVWLAQREYNSYYAGKLYNEHTAKNFDRQGKYSAGWKASDFLVHPKVYTYHNSTFQHNEGEQHDQAVNVTGYSTHQITDHALGYIDDAVSDEKPFFVVAAPIAPHASHEFFPIPEKKYNGTFSHLQVPRAPNFNPEEASGVLHIHDLAQITQPEHKQNLDHLYQKRIESLQSVDDMVGKIVQKLEEHDILDNTYIIYTSDNGYHIGHHRMAPGKKCAFEEDINVPLIIRGPQIAKNMESNLVTGHVDLAPTIMNMVGLEYNEKDYKLDGQGLVLPLESEEDFEREKNARGEHVNIEMWGIYFQEGSDAPEIDATHTYKALRIQGEEYDLMYSVWCNRTAHELYDMTNDQYQMNNIHPDAQSATSDKKPDLLGRPIEEVLARLDALLLVQKSCKQETCTRPWEQLHPDGKVASLKNALDEEYDCQYASYPKIQYDRCLNSSVYIPEIEGPMWPQVQEMSGNNCTTNTNARLLI